MSIAVEFLDVVKQFPGAVEPAVDHVSFQIQEQEMITILGTSGCGKTTLMKMVNRLYEPTSGEIRIFGENYRTDGCGGTAQKDWLCYSAGRFVPTYDCRKKYCSGTGNPRLGFCTDT